MLEPTRAAAAPKAARGIDVVTSWRTRAELTDRGGDWVLVESADGGGVAVGPVFGPRRACFGCYLQRRGSNGAVDCRPATATTEAARRALAATLAPLLAGDASPLAHAQRVIEGDGASRDHRFFPLPDCARCWRARWPAARVGDLIDARLGVVHRVDVASRGALAIARASGARVPSLRGYSWNDGVAVDEDPRRAREGAVRASVARYASTFVHRDDVLAFADALGDGALDPRAFDAGPVDPGAPQRWVPATRATGEGARLWVPATLAYGPLPYDAEPTHPAPRAPTARGLAAGASRDDAIARASLDVLATDAGVPRDLDDALRAMIVVDLTTPDLALAGVHVVRALLPGGAAPARPSA